MVEVIPLLEEKRNLCPIFFLRYITAQKYLVLCAVEGLCLETRGYGRYELTEEEQVRTIQKGSVTYINSLSIVVLELSGMVLAVCDMIAVRKDKPELEGGTTVLLKENN